MVISVLIVGEELLVQELHTYIHSFITVITPATPTNSSKGSFDLPFKILGSPQEKMRSVHVEGESQKPRRAGDHCQFLLFQFNIVLSIKCRRECTTRLKLHGP